MWQVLNHVETYIHQREKQALFYLIFVVCDLLVTLDSAVDCFEDVFTYIDNSLLGESLRPV